MGYTWISMDLQYLSLLQRNRWTTIYRSQVQWLPCLICSTIVLSGFDKNKPKRTLFYGSQAQCLWLPCRNNGQPILQIERKIFARYWYANNCLLLILCIKNPQNFTSWWRKLEHQWRYKDNLSLHKLNWSSKRKLCNCWQGNWCRESRKSLLYTLHYTTLNILIYL